MATKATVVVEIAHTAAVVDTVVAVANAVAAVEVVMDAVVAEAVTEVVVKVDVQIVHVADVQNADRSRLIENPGTAQIMCTPGFLFGENETSEQVNRIH